ncbi:hypothetical protein [Bacillus horti]|uniref:hypothetical protein n=1 Tax=Caldalkalibacillus horti TaxID=77523 RepID=UPI0027D88A40|nr:hypothetical protein [Bacillus horti]
MFKKKSLLVIASLILAFGVLAGCATDGDTEPGLEPAPGTEPGLDPAPGTEPGTDTDLDNDEDLDLDNDEDLDLDNDTEDDNG